MHLAYFDEAGDDGFPQYSSPLFVLTSVYLHYMNWKPIFEAVRNFRRHIKTVYDLPTSMEMHTRDFLLNKKPYVILQLGFQQRTEIIGLFCDLIASLELKVINTVIIKPRIQKSDYEVLDTALKFTVQRIENDLNPRNNPSHKFMIITDPGRVGKMTRTTRKIQRINFIPSKYGAVYRKEISSLIEDPLPKDSSESYFIQIADLVSYIVYLYASSNIPNYTYPKRMGDFVSPDIVREWMERLKTQF